MPTDSDATVPIGKREFYSRIKQGRTNLHPAHWPEDVHIVSMEGLEYLGLDSKGHLYLDGERVYSTKRWSNSERLIALTGVLAALIAAIAGLVTAWNSYVQTRDVDASQVDVVTNDTNAPLDLVLQVLGERADDAGALAVTYPDQQRWKAVLGAAGAPVELGILSLKEKPAQEKYEVVAFFGNLSATHLGECSASVTLSAANGNHESVDVEFAGYFRSGKASIFGFEVPSSLVGAEQITISTLRCGDKLYEDGPAPEPS